MKPLELETFIFPCLIRVLRFYPWSKSLALPFYLAAVLAARGVIKSG